MHGRLCVEAWLKEVEDILTLEKESKVVLRVLAQRVLKFQLCYLTFLAFLELFCFPDVASFQYLYSARTSPVGGLFDIDSDVVSRREFQEGPVCWYIQSL